MKDTVYECMKHGWRSDYQVCPFCMILVLQEDIVELKERLAIKDDIITGHILVEEAYEKRLGEYEKQLEARFTENKELYGHWQNALDQNAKPIGELEQQLERYKQRDGNAYIKLSYATEAYPFNFTKLNVADFGISDNEYIVTSELFDSLQAQNAKLVEVVKDWMIAWQRWCDRYPNSKGFEDTRACYELAAAIKEVRG